MFKKSCLPAIVLFFFYFGAFRPSYGLEVFSPVGISTAGIYYHPENPMESSLYLASGSGSFNRTGFTLGYNYLPEGNGYWGSFFVPTEIGVFGINYMHFDDTADNSGSKGIFKGGFGKQLTRDLFFGFYLDFFFQNPAAIKSYIGIEPSLIYSFKLKKTRLPVGFHNFFIYSGFYNLNVPLEKSSISNDPGIFAGFGVKFISADNFSGYLQFQSAIDSAVDIIPLSAAIKLQYLYFQLRAGYQYRFALNSASEETRDFTAGAGVEYKFDEFTINIQYGLNEILSGNPGHYFSINSYFNTKDKTSPGLFVKTNFSDFSPNGDGVKDYLEFKVKVRDESSIKSWILEIKNSKGEKVKTFKKDNRSRSIYFPLYRIVTDLFKRNEYRFVPEKIIWEGRGESTGSIADSIIQPEPIDLPEGQYFYEMTVTDEQGLVSEPSRGSVIIDRTKPEAVLSRNTLRENPESGIFFSAVQNPPANENTTSRGYISDSNGKIIREFSWDYNTPLSHNFSWNGMTQKNKPAAEGYYSYTLEVTDPAGNTSLKEIHQIAVFHSKKQITVSTENPVLSPNRDGINDVIEFKADSLADNITRWKAVITRSEIKDMDKIYPVFTWQGTDQIPVNFTWDGKNQYENRVPDQRYFFTVIGEKSSGEKVSSPGLPFYLDSRPPAVSVIPGLQKISPDGDGIHDDMYFYISCQDQSKIKNYEFSVYEVMNRGGVDQKKIFRQWVSEGSPPKKIYFNGIGVNGNLMESLKKYEYSLKVTDVFENIATIEKQKIFSGILVNAAEGNLKITLTGQKFLDDGMPVERENLFKIFNLLINDYPDYRVRVESHTSSPGDEVENLVLSEKRAKKIVDYFYLWGMEPGKIAYQGYGEILPLTEIESEEAYNKNNRVEFVLMKRISEN
jgi:flagellar motor protein MotB/flagellar hook assembly protein FlgD